MSAHLAYDDEGRLKPSVRSVIEALRAKGHTVLCSRLTQGCWRFKLDDETPWVSASKLKARAFRLYGLAPVVVEIRL